MASPPTERFPTSRVDGELEIELLAESAASLRAIAGRDTLGPYRLRPRGVAQLRTTYLDTPRHTLLGNNIALRLRRRGRAWEATAKWGGGVTDALHTRREVNVVLPHRARLPFVLPEGPLRDELTAFVLGRPLRPMLTTRIRRQLFALVDESDTVAAELALDTVRHGRDESDLREPYFGVEIEQRTAAIDDLHALGRLLRDEHGLAPADETKFQRARRTVFGAAPPPPGPIGAGDNWQNAARKIAAAQLTRLRACDARVRSGPDPDPESIHQMRVATRRLRTVCKLFAEGIPEPTRTLLAADLEWLDAALGGARDLDVQRAQLEAIGPSIGAAEPTVPDFRRELAAARPPALDDLRAALGSARYVRLLRRLERFATPPARLRRGAASAANVCGAAATAVASAHRAVRKQARRALRDSGALAYHKLRIRIRRYRYLLEFLAPLIGDDSDWLIARMTLLQDLLGEANDRVVLARQLRRRGAAVAAQRQPLEESADDLLLAAGALHESFRRRWKDDSRRIRKRTRRIVDVLERQERPAAAGA